MRGRVTRSSGRDDFDYVAVGHVTVDVLLSAMGIEQRQAGGSALYSALQAARLGLRTLLLTAGQPDELRELLAPFAAEIELEVVSCEHTTTLQTTRIGSNRSQRLISWADPIPAAKVPAKAKVMHFAPVARETPPQWRGQAQLVGLTPQGLLRRWEANGGEITLAPLDPADLPKQCDAVVLSEAERESCRALCDRENCHDRDPSASRSCGALCNREPERDSGGELCDHEAERKSHRALCDREPSASRLRTDDRPRKDRHATRPLIAITAGEGPTEVRLPDGTHAFVPPLPIQGVHDDLGAGDVFAAGFFIALSEGKAPLQAAEFGNAAAAVRIGGVGPAAIGERAAIERLLAG
jgi:sugar/nucleoside kinase (ribokinase family)